MAITHRKVERTQLKTGKKKTINIDAKGMQIDA